MKKKIAALAAAVMIVSAGAVFAADAPSSSDTGDSGNPSYCYNRDGHRYCNGNTSDDTNGAHHRGCWRN